MKSARVLLPHSQKPAMASFGILMRGFDLPYNDTPSGILIICVNANESVMNISVSPVSMASRSWFSLLTPTDSTLISTSSTALSTPSCTSALSESNNDVKGIIL